MGKVIFECRFFKIKVRDIIILLVVVFLLGVMYMSSLNKPNNEKKKENSTIDEVVEESSDDKMTKEEKEELMKEKLNNTCDFTKTNINDFNDLISRVDLCGEQWFSDLDLFIKRIEEQNLLLKVMTDKAHKNVYNHQVSWLKEIIKLRDSQSEQNIESVEKVFKEYKRYYEKTCTMKNVGE